MGNFNLSEVAKDLIINIINIVVLFVVIRALVYKPVKKFLDARKERIENEKAELDQKLKEANQTALDRDNIIAEAKQEAQKQLQDAKVAASVEAERITSKAKKDAQAIVEEAESAAEAQKRNAIVSAKSQIGEIAVAMTEKILDREVSFADNEKAVDDFLKELGE